MRISSAADAEAKAGVAMPPGAEAFGVFEDILKSGSDLRVRVTGKSMSPFLRGGEIVTIKRADAGSMRLGDLIFFRNTRGSHVLHRVVRKRRREDGLLVVQTKGDAVFFIDHPVACDEVLGRVCMIEKAGRAGRKRGIDMDSFYWRGVNRFFAAGHLTAANICSAFLRLINAARAL